jgi:hypothetical protein
MILLSLSVLFSLARLQEFYPKAIEFDYGAWCPLSAMDRLTRY